MSENDRVEIPLSAEAAEAQIDNLIAKLEQADDLLLKLREDAAKAFSQATGLYSNKAALGGPASAPFSVAQQAAAQYSPSQLSSAFGPQFATSMQAVQQRQTTLEQSLRTFLQSPSFRPGSQSDILSAFRSYAAVPPPSSQALTPTTPSSRPVPITVSSEFTQQLARALESYSRPLLMTATMSMTQMMGRSGLGGFSPLAFAGARGLAGLGLGATLAGAGAVGVGALGLAASNVEATFLRRQALLAASEYGGAPSTTEGAATQGLGVNFAAQQFNFDSAQASKTAVQLAMAGVPQGQLLGALGSTFALGRSSGLGPDQIAPLTGVLMAQGGLNQQQVAATYQTLTNLSKGYSVSMNRLISDLQDLTRETGNASVGIAGLTAVQKTLGAAINAGQLLAPGLGASGSSGLAAAAVLGVSPDALLRMQSSPTGAAAMWDKMGALVRRVDASGGGQGTMVAEQLLQAAGLVDWTGIGAPQQARIIGLLRSGKAGQAQALARQMSTTASSQAVPEAQWLTNVANATRDQTGALERSTIALNNWTQALLNANPGTPTGGLVSPVRRGPPVGIGGPSLHAGQYYGVPNFHGGTSKMSVAVMQDLLAASNATGVPLNILLAQAAAEDTNPRTGMVDPSLPGGLGQFSPATLKGLNAMLGTNYHANVPAQAAMAMAEYDRYLANQYGGDYVSALNAYNSGTPYSGYGPQVMQVSVELSGKLDVVDSSGRVVGTVDVSQATSKVKYQTNASRKPAGATPHHQPPPRGHR